MRDLLMSFQVVVIPSISRMIDERRAGPELHSSLILESKSR